MPGIATHSPQECPHVGRERSGTRTAPVPLEIGLRRAATYGAKTSLRKREDMEDVCGIARKRVRALTQGANAADKCRTGAERQSRRNGIRWRSHFVAVAYSRCSSTADADDAINLFHLGRWTTAASTRAHAALLAFPHPCLSLTPAAPKVLGRLTRKGNHTGRAVMRASFPPPGQRRRQHGAAAELHQVRGFMSSPSW